MDIVERLRKPVSKDDPYICTNTDVQPEIKYDLLRSQAANEIERLREALNKISSEYREIANPDSFQKEIREVLQNPNVFTMIASIIHRYEKCVRIARAALKEGEA